MTGLADKLGAYVDQPLALVAIVLALLFGLFWILMKSGTIPTVGQGVAGRALLHILCYGFVVAIVAVVLGFIASTALTSPIIWLAGFAFLAILVSIVLWFNHRGRRSVDVDKIVTNLMEANRKRAESETERDFLKTQRLEDQKIIDALREAVSSLAAHAKGPDRPAGIDRALTRLARGDRTAAEGVFETLLKSHQAEGSTASKEAAAAARNLGALAYGHDMQRALRAYRDATRLEPDNLWSWIMLGRVEEMTGNPPAAEAAFLEARKRAEATRSERDIAVINNDLGDVRKAQGDLLGALGAYEVALTIAKRLAAENPANHELQRDLAVSHNRIGELRLMQGGALSAIENYHSSQRIMERLAEADPANNEWQRDLAVCHNKIGDALKAEDRLTEALAEYQASFPIAERLATANPGNREWQRDLSFSRNRIGDVRLAQSDATGALTDYRASLAIVERLAKADPAQSEWQRDLSVCRNKIGDALKALGDFVGALTEYREGHAIAQRLAASSPTHSEWQRDVSFSLNRIGDMRRALGDPAAALADYEASLEISERLAALDVTHKQRQRDLMFIHGRIGITKNTLGDVAGALASYEKSLAIAEQVAAAEKTAP